MGLYPGPAAAECGSEGDETEERCSHVEAQHVRGRLGPFPSIQTRIMVCKHKLLHQIMNRKCQNKLSVFCQLSVAT